MSKIVRITESDLHRIIKESVKKILKEAHGEPESYPGIISTSILDDNEAEEMANEYNLTPEEAAMEWFKGVDIDFEENVVPKWREFVCKVPELGAELYHDYGAGYYFLIKGQFNENTIKEATAGGGASGGLIGFSSNIGNGSGIAAGTTNTQNTPQGNGDNTIFGKGLTSKKKKKSNTDIINHGRDIYNARGNGKSSDNENSDFFGDTTKRKNGKGGSISIPKHRV